MPWERIVDPQNYVGELVTGMHNQGCVTNIVREETDIAEYGRGTTKEVATFKDDKIDHKCGTVETQFNPRYGNILFLGMDTANNEMGGIPLRVDDGYQSGLIRQTIGLHKGM